MMLERALTPLAVGLRRLAARPLQTAGIALAVAATGALLAWTSLTGALAGERNVRLRLAEESAAARSVHVIARIPAGLVDAEPAAVRAELSQFAELAEATRRVRVWNPISPSDEEGTRLVVAENGPARDEVSVTQGRAPGPCSRGACEALALVGPFRVGEVVRLGGVPVRIVGRGLVGARALPDPGVLEDEALLVPEIGPTLAPLLAGRGNGVTTTLVLRPDRVRAHDLEALTARLRQAGVRIERADTGLRFSAPLSLLEELASRTAVARERLLLVAGQAIALVLAFAAFAARSRREDVELAEEQLATFGASRSQAFAARATEIAVPALAGGLLALVAARIAVEVVARREDLDRGFAREALPASTTLGVLAVALAGALVLLAASSQRARRRSVGPIGPLEVAALAGLGVLLWQATAAGALDPAQVEAGGGGPILLLLPALAFFAGGVLLMRLLPLAFRGAERLARRSRFPLRLALLSAARDPVQAAATTTFLAVALGSALFSLNYRATLDEQARDEARFRAGAPVRVLEQGPLGDVGPTNVAPLTRYAQLTDEEPAPALRVPASLRETAAATPVSFELLGVPAERLGQLVGWRPTFSLHIPAEIGRRLRPEPVRLGGPEIPAEARELRLWVRARTNIPRRGALHFLLPGQDFRSVGLGPIPERWTHLRVPLTRELRGAQLVGVEFPGPFTESSFDGGDVEFGGLETTGPQGARPLGPIDDWVATPSTTGPSGSASAERFRDAPVRRGIRFRMNSTFQPLLRPVVELTLPAVLGPELAARAVDGRVDVTVSGIDLTLLGVSTARLFPTIVEEPRAFAVVDYDAAFAALNVDYPGSALPSEAWFFEPKPPAFAAAAGRAPFRLDQLVDARQVERRLRQDPLAAGTRDVLWIAAVAALVLGLAGLVLATRSALRAERTTLAEYEALGVPPSSLARSVQLRLVTLSAFGLVAGLLAGIATLALVGSLVAVTGASATPLPEIRSVVSWPLSLIVLTALAVGGLGAAALLAGRDLRRSAAARLRA